MSEVKIKDVPSVQSIKDTDKFPVSVGDDNAHTVTAKTIKEFCGSGGGLTRVTWDDVIGKPEFKPIATTGSYNDLTQTPLIPSRTSDLTNNSGFTTLNEVNKVGYIRKPFKAVSKGGVAKINVNDNTTYTFESPVTELTINVEKECEIGSNIYFTSGSTCKLILPTSVIKIGDFDHILPNQRYAISVKDNYIAIAKEGYFLVGGKEVVELDGALINIQLEPNKIYLIDCFKNNINTEKITILNNLNTFDESQIFVMNVQKPIQLVLPNDVIKFGNVPTSIEAGQVLKIDVQLNCYTGFIGG